MESKHYDVFVIGSGIAGQTVAKICTKNSLKVAVADKREYGGTCAIRGCDPKKVLMQFAYLIQQTKQLKANGVTKMPKIDWETVQEFKSTFTQPVPKHTESDLNNLGIDLYHQSPKFKSKTEILVEGKKVSADKFIIATGLVPRKLDFKGSDFLKNSDDILNLKKIPKSAVFLGSGYVGMEFAYMLSTMGCKVTIIDTGERPLTQFDEFLVEKLADSMKNSGVKFIFNSNPTQIEKLKKNYKVTYEHKGKINTVKARAVFNTAGRVPAIELLDLEKANIEQDESGITVNDFLQSVSNNNVYACGDVSSKSVPLTPLSGLQGYIVGENIVNGNNKTFENPLVPSVVFTYPNIASVGYSEDEAKSRYKEIKIFKGDASDWYNAKKENTNAYAYKIIVNQRTQKIVGAHLLSPLAYETINLFAMAINNEMTVYDFKKMIFTYPSYANDIKSMFADKE